MKLDGGQTSRAGATQLRRGPARGGLDIRLAPFGEFDGRHVLHCSRASSASAVRALSESTEPLPRTTPPG